MRNSLRQTTWQGSFNFSSSSIKLNDAGMIPLNSEISSAAPVTDMSRIVQGVFMPPYSILAGFMTRWRGAILVSTICAIPYRNHHSQRADRPKQIRKLSRQRRGRFDAAEV